MRLPAARENAVIQDLIKRKSETDDAYADALNQYGPNYPKVQRLAAQQKEVADDLASAQKTMVESIQEEYNTARSHVEILQGALDKQKAEANDLAEKLVQYHILQHDAEANKQLYDGLLQKLKEATISAGLRSSNIRVVDPALVPTSTVAAAEVAKYSAGVSGRPGRRNRPGDLPRVSRQHGEVAGRHRNADRSAVAGRGSCRCRA